ncbi:MAG: hypothetical protein U5N86_00185 [Planctomycetota bacterium]|nr:hypothetical protein [Planctomycetota bacterium]
MTRKDIFVRLIYTILLAAAALLAIGFTPHGRAEQGAAQERSAKKYSPFTIEMTKSNRAGDVQDVTITVHTTADLNDASLTLITFGDLTVLEAPEPYFSLLAGQTCTFTATVAAKDAATLTAEVSAHFGTAAVVDNSQMEFGHRPANPDFKPAPQHRMRVQNVQVK